MSPRPANDARELIEGLIRGWFDVMTPVERAEEGAKLVGTVAAQMACHCDRETTANLFWILGDKIATSKPIGGAG